eukprot:1158781-Pelagomonas_calceolata.AAC.1
MQCPVQQIRNGDKEIFRAVRTQGGAHAQARSAAAVHELEHGQNQILDLFQQVTKIQTKAEESENVVQDICSWRPSPRALRLYSPAYDHLTNSADLEACAGERQSCKCHNVSRLALPFLLVATFSIRPGGLCWPAPVLQARCQFGGGCAPAHGALPAIRVCAQSE